ncbi:hypothetical protein ACJX0J_020493, partial [Zea mays]
HHAQFFLCVEDLAGAYFSLVLVQGHTYHVTGLSILSIQQSIKRILLCYLALNQHVNLFSWENLREAATKHFPTLEAPVHVKIVGIFFYLYSSNKIFLLDECLC